MSGPFTAPKVWALREVLEYDDLNALAAEIADSVNNIVDAQIASDAAIDASKVATGANGFGNAKFADDAIIGSALNPGAATKGVSSSVSVSPVTLDATYQDLATVNRTVGAGRVVVVGIATFDVTFTVVTATQADFRLDKGGSPLGQVFTATPYKGEITEVKGGAIIIPFIEAPGAGAETWKMQATKGALTGTWVVRSCQLWVWEWL